MVTNPHVQVELVEFNAPPNTI